MIIIYFLIALIYIPALTLVEGNQTDVAVNKRRDQRKESKENQKFDLDGDLKPYVPTARDLIKDQEALLAALIDRQHLSWYSFLVKQNVTLDPDTVKSLITDKMMLMTLKVLPDLSKLAKMTNNKEKSAKKICIHFDSEHLRPHAQALDGKQSRRFIDSMVRGIHQLMCGFVQIILINYS
ncbi:hypothetical protein J6590_103455 [Homalodisca vitripennis]|nr:hypothetical protein J6590_103455 [Homalodisca vitripennis]